MSKPESTPRKSSPFVIDFEQETEGSPFDSIVMAPKPVNDKDEEIEDPETPFNENEDEEEDVVETSDEDDDVDNDEEEDDSSQEEGNEEEDDDDEDVGDEESDPNPYYYLAKQLKEDGNLDDDFEITEDIDGTSIFGAYKQKMERALENQVTERIHQTLASQGINNQDITMARAVRMAINQGIDLRTLSQPASYEMYSAIPDSAEDNQKIDTIRAMLYDRGLKEKEVERLTPNPDDDDIDISFKEAKQYFGEKYSTWKEEQEKEFERQRLQELAAKERTEEIIRQRLSERKLLNEQLTKEEAEELQQAIYTPNRIIEANGQRYKATEMQEFMVEFNQNPELIMYLFKKWKYRDQEKQKAVKEAKRQVEKDFMSEYKKVVRLDKTKGNKASKSKRSGGTKSTKTILDFSQQS